MHKRHETKAKTDKAAKTTRIEVKKIPKRNEKISYKPRYVPGSWKGTKETPIDEKVSYKQRYIPGSWKGTTENPKIGEKVSYEQRYIKGQS